MKIAMLSWNTIEIGVGGVQGHVHFIAEELIALGHEVQIIELSTMSRQLQTTGRFAVRATRLLTGDTVAGFVERILEGFRIRGLAKTLLSQLGDVDIVHFHDFLRILLLARRLRGKYTIVWTNHLGEFIRLMDLPGGRHLTRRMTRVFDAAIGPSNQLAESSSVSPPITYIPNGVALGRFPLADDNARAASRQALGLSQKPLVLVPRRWAPTKGVLDAARAARLLKDSEIAFAFLGSAGAEDYPTYGEAIRTELDGLQNATILPSVAYSEMSTWLRAADVVLIPSKLEATSLSALEAMSSGAIVLASEAGGLAQLISHGVTGFLLSDTRGDLLSEAIMMVFSQSEEIRADVRRQAAAMVAADYSWALVARETVAVYSVALRSRGRVAMSPFEVREIEAR